MATGDIAETKRVRYEPNERFDEDDAQTESELSLTREAMVVKSLLGGLLPFSAGSGQTVGAVIQGGTLTGSVGPGQATLDAPLFVGVDADGGLIIKSAGAGSLTISVPNNQSTVYAYGIDNPTDLDRRAFVPATAPFTEFFKAMNTRFTMQVGIVAIAGDSTVRETVINGKTRPLVALGLVNNSGGTVTITKLFSNVLQTVPPVALARTFVPTVTPAPAGATTYTYVVVARGRKGEVLFVSAPVTIANGPATLDGSNTNRITIPLLAEAQDYDVYRTAGGTTQGKITVVPIVPYLYQGSLVPATSNIFIDTGFDGGAETPPTTSTGSMTMPTNNTDRGGAGGANVFTAVDLAHTALSRMADMLWRGSMPGTQSNKQTYADNFGAYRVPRNGLDIVDRHTSHVYTVGDGISTFGDYDLANYANFAALLLDLFSEINKTATASVTGTTGHKLNHRFLVILKSGTYTMTGNTTTPQNVTFIGDQTGHMSDSYVSNTFTYATNGAVLQLAGFTWTLGLGSSMENLLVFQGTSATEGTGRIRLSGNNEVKTCQFGQVIGLGGTENSFAGALQNVTGGGTISNLMVTGCRFRLANQVSASTAIHFSGIHFVDVRNVTIRDCAFSTTSQIDNFAVGQRPTSATMLAIRAPRDAIAVYNCKFWVGAGGASPTNIYQNTGGGDVGQALMRVGQASGDVTDARNVLVDGCSFVVGVENGALPNAPLASASYNYQGLQLEDERSVEVRSCAFTGFVNGLLATFTGNTFNYNYQHGGLHHNSFQFNTNGLRLLATVAAVNVRDLPITDNLFITNTIGILIAGATTGHVIAAHGLVLDRNQFRNASASGTTGISMQIGSTTNMSICKNVFDTIGAAMALVALPSTWSNTTICENRGQGCGPVAFLSITPNSSATTTLRNAKINKNQVDTYALSTVVDCIVVTANVITVLDFCENQVTACYTGLTNANTTRPWIFNLKTQDGVMSNVRIHDNILGDGVSQGAWLRIDHNDQAVLHYNISILGNKFAALFGAGQAGLLNNTEILVGNTGSRTWSYIGLIIDENAFYCEQQGVNGALFFGGQGTSIIIVQAAHAHGARLCLNTFHFNSGGLQAGGAHGPLLTLNPGAAYDNSSVKVIGNSATNQNSGTVNFAFRGSYASGTAGVFQHNNNA